MMVSKNYYLPKIQYRIVTYSMLLFFGNFISVHSWATGIIYSSSHPFSNIVCRAKITNIHQTYQRSRVHHILTRFAENYDSNESTANTLESLPDASDMKLRDIQAELKDRGVSFSDCFDRDSLTIRLKEARSISATKIPSKDKEDTSLPKNDDVVAEEEDISPKHEESIASEQTADNGDSSATSSSSKFDRESTLKLNRSLRVAELRTQLASRNIRWAGMLEKEELVVTLTNAMEESASFSPSGVLSPGKVAELTDNTLSQELQQANDSILPPLLLDVYATWCGPCKMMAPELEKVAIELGSTVRVAKLDSDKNTFWASKLKVQGLPTVILFDGKTGKELDRVEGALPFDSLVSFARKSLL